jgi:hypothetical protein
MSLVVTVVKRLVQHGQAISQRDEQLSTPWMTPRDAYSFRVLLPNMDGYLVTSLHFSMEYECTNLSTTGAHQFNAYGLQEGQI